MPRYARYPVKFGLSARLILRRWRFLLCFLVLCSFLCAAERAVHHGFAGTPAHGSGIVGRSCADGSGCMITSVRRG
jgi:hypothetical protein